MKLKLGILSYFLLLLLLSGYAQKNRQKIHPGQIWRDTDGNAINAHGAGVLNFNGTYYLYGEIKKGTTWLVPGQGWECYRVASGGISCYASKDLVNWKYMGVALSPTVGISNHDLDTGRVIERPKIIYNSKTKKFVMWMHIDSRDYTYSKSGVAISSSPEGPFTFIESVSPNGNTARDMTIFQDDDGKAYHLFSSDLNHTMRIVLLSDDYLSHTKFETRILIDNYREAPAAFKRNGKYYLITSGCTGWSPNSASCSMADSMLGEWQVIGNPCQGKDAKETFKAQSTYVLPLQDTNSSFVFMADVWNKTNLEDSRYVWLPLNFAKGKPVTKWKRQWKPSLKPMISQ